ncbi:uncharacterized protein LOC107776330 [Nicotiana tabacum]|uniref:Uncharacterized protein LOC107776330 n=1 Tax=Nicotiana tabacum TaxID=4097 RepID=A0A1S3YHG7_TOBAC|nr:PREDICTED: uncharacterized protein LOC107776330 [Nicotiana tabacum]
MDSYSYAAISSSSSSIPYPQEVKKSKPLPSYHSSFHGVRRLPLKPMTKQPIAPLPPTRPKIYRVEPVNFKEVVQMLTAAPEFQSSSDSSSGSGSGSGFGSSSSSSSSSRRLQDVAPPPLDLSPVSLPRNNNIAAEWRQFLRPSTSSNNRVESISAAYNDSTIEAQERSHGTPQNPSENYFGSCSPLANFPLSPASFAWCCSLLLSPSTLTSPRPVL